ncbi:MAG: hypothetical protein KDB27_14690 [Planctomycetales bacterium]|nr:hypothetical protein [Planctomycetales bacterium]
MLGFNFVKVACRHLGRAKKKQPPSFGLGQLSLVEHAICPLDSSISLVPNLTHHSEIAFTDKNRHRRSGYGTVHATFGLSAVDEFYLWGLLGLTFAQKELTLDFRATPHFVLRALGRIDRTSKRGGSAYQIFRDSLKRLAGVTYESDCFYDPVRAEHRDVAFGFLSYSLPRQDDSCRAWRILWDPLFFELCQATGGRLFFDIDTYRELDPATRRLFLFLSKVFWRRKLSGWFDVAALAHNVLGISPSVDIRDIRAKKLARPMKRLVEIGVLAPERAELERKIRKGVYQICFERGSYFGKSAPQSQVMVSENPVADQLQSLGINAATIATLLRQYKIGLLQEWIDITLAAQERNGVSFFKKSPAAYFLDNVKHAAEGTRTAPDWWHELRKEELAAADNLKRREDKTIPVKREAAFRNYLNGDAKGIFETLLRETFDSFVASGQNKSEAQKNAVEVVRKHLEHRFEAEHPEWRTFSY